MQHIHEQLQGRTVLEPSFFLPLSYAVKLTMSAGTPPNSLCRLVRPVQTDLPPLRTTFPTTQPTE